MSDIWAGSNSLTKPDWVAWHTREFTDNKAAYTDTWKTWPEFKAADKNGDGQLDGTEHSQAMSTLFDRIDQNKNGMVTKDEALLAAIGEATAAQSVVKLWLSRYWWVVLIACIIVALLLVAGLVVFLRRKG